MHRLRKRLLLVGALVRVHAVRGGQIVVGRGLVCMLGVRGRLLYEQERIDLVLQVRERHIRLRNGPDLVRHVLLRDVQRALGELVLGLPGRYQERERGRIVYGLPERLLLVGSRV